MTGRAEYRSRPPPGRVPAPTQEEKPVSVTGHDSLKARRTLEVDGRRYDYFSLAAAADAAGLGDLSRLPFSLIILL